MYNAELPNVSQEMKECRNALEMEATYRKIKESILQLWNTAWYSPPSRYKSFWARRVDQLSRHRTRLSRKAKVTEEQADKERHSGVEKLVKKVAKINKNGQRTYHSKLQTVHIHDLGNLYRRLVSSTTSSDKFLTRELNGKCFTENLKAKSE